MKCRQYNVKVFEVGMENPDDFLGFLEANRSLLANHLLSIQGEEDPRVLSYLEENGFYYLFNRKLPPAKRGVEKFRMLVREEEEATVPSEVAEAMERIRELRRRKEQEREEEPPSPERSSEAEASSENVENVEEESAERESGEPPLRILRGPLRSGQFVEYDGSVLLTERMNSGAKIAALGSVIALNTVEGEISSVGECVIVPPMKRGTLFFHGVRIEGEELRYPLNKVTFHGDRIQIQPLNKKEFH